MMNSSETLKKYNFFEINRFNSFKSWPFNENSICNIKKMAEAGFYWCGTETENDIAACFMCGKVLDGWEEHDEPWFEHKKHAPQCPFVKNGKKETEYTVKQFLELIEVFIKIHMEKQFTATVTSFKEETEKLREQIKQMYGM